MTDRISTDAKIKTARRAQRRFQPSLQGLECRALASADPIPGALGTTNPVIDAGYPDGPPTLSFNLGVGGKQGDPTIYSAVGEYVDLLITPAYGHKLIKVVVTIPSAIDPDQTGYGLNIGKATRLTSPITKVESPPASGESAAWDWDETVGSRTVQVDATYEDSVVAHNTITCVVEAPTVESHTIYGNPIQFNTYDGFGAPQTNPAKIEQIGFIQSNPLAETYSAQFLNSTTINGNFFFVQVLTGSLSYKVSTKPALQVFTIQTGGDLDQFTNANSIAVENAQVMLAVGQQGNLPPSTFSQTYTDHGGNSLKTGYIFDAPGFSPQPGTLNGTQFLQEVHQDITFTLNLCYQANGAVGGIPIVLSSASYHLKEDAVLNANAQSNAGQYVVANWTYTITGDGVSQFAKYGDNTRKLLAYVANINTDKSNQGFLKYGLL